MKMEKMSRLKKLSRQTHTIVKLHYDIYFIWNTRKNFLKDNKIQLFIQDLESNATRLMRDLTQKISTN